MWLWILSGLFLALMWTAFWLLSPPEGVPGEGLLPFWVALTITLVVVGILVALVVYRRVRAARAARALEKAIAQQAQDQVLTAKPEDRAEVRELQKQMLGGINALKTSRLGDGKAGNALYALPWYAIVGPPGAGKTTALRHSGLSFPHLGADGGGVRGVGGTRNCDWWFTNDAILLDTAGRYTTEHDDHDEWMAFLGMLRHYRKRKPLNGIIVAVSVSELIDATEDEIEQLGERIRDRIDEMQEQLKMVLPVYVTFTKSDLVAGFAEFFGGLKRSERGEAWGATLPLSQDRSDPAGIFDSEFDTLVEQLHRRTIRRMNDGRPSRAAKEKIYQFPLEFAAIKRNLSDFIGAAFRPAANTDGKKGASVPTPILRGFYFTSGTQEGRPLDRVVGAMGRAFGLRPADQEDKEPTESKSFFLKEVFTEIIFPDQDIAGHTLGEASRLRWQRMAVAAAACVVALLLMVPAILSYFANRDLIAETARLSAEVAAVKWDDGQDPNAKIDRLDALRDNVFVLDQWDTEGAPISMRWGMYQGETLLPAAVEHYVDALRAAFLERVKVKLEQDLNRPQGKRWIEEYNQLKTYLLLDKPSRLPQYKEWQLARLTTLWSELLRSQASTISDQSMRERLWPHVGYYIDLLIRRAATVRGEKLDDSLIQSTRARLSRVSAHQRYYDQFVTVLEDEQVDPNGENSVDNLKYPPITLNGMFQDRPDALRKISSKRMRRERKPQKIRGPYTAPGHHQVLANLKEGYKKLEREQWVVPLSLEERRQPGKIKKALERVREDYDKAYKQEWMEFFHDIDVAVPQNNIEAISEFRILATPDWPYWRLLRALKENTQFPQPKSKEEEAAKRGGVIDQLKRRVQQRIDSKLRVQGASRLLTDSLQGKGGREDPVPKWFEKTVQFGFPAAVKEGEGPPESELAGYVAQLEDLAGEMTIIAEGGGGASPEKATKLFEKAVAATEKKLNRMDPIGQELMRELLMNPLRQSYKAMVHSAGGAASGLWEVEVWPAYRDTIKNRYPFNRSARRDASFEDVVEFLKPKDGVLWGFYGNHLESYHRRVGHKFFPNTSLQGIPRPMPAMRYTPFNPQMYNCLERAHEITDALFSQGDPGIRFRINLTTVSPIVSEIVFDLDGQRRVYRNEKEFWHSFVWPGPESKAPRSATISVRGAGGLNEDISREGPWGFWRLLEAGRHSAKKDDDRTFTVEWQMTAPPVVVKMQVKPTRGNHPMSRNFFRDTNCPASIGDRFGPG